MGAEKGIGRIERICAHAQSLAQCRAWLQEHLPHVEKIARGEQRGSCAPCARRARHRRARGRRRRRGLRSADSRSTMSRTGGQHHALPGGRPRRCFPPSGSDKTSILVSASGTGGHPACCCICSSRSPPRGQHDAASNRGLRARKKWDYVFFVDLDGHAEDNAGHSKALRRGEAEVRAVQSARRLSQGGPLEQSRRRVTQRSRISVPSPAHSVAGESPFQATSRSRIAR